MSTFSGHSNAADGLTLVPSIQDRYICVNIIQKSTKQQNIEYDM